MKRHTMLALSVVAFVALSAAFLFFSRHHSERRTLFRAATWQHMTMPGELSQPHAFLENNCAACHTQIKGVEAKNCIVCHADNKSLLQRQPTAFHAEINACTACHLEHQGRVPSTTQMDHVSLAGIGLKQLKSEPERVGEDLAEITRWLEKTSTAPKSALAHLRPEEELLNCASCHETKEPHRGFFGMDCAQCHGTAKWTIAEFRHPSSASQSCAQCHQAPPSHYMEHFRMICQSVARQPNASVDQCYKCHQTTSWNDIQGVGFYKHH
jgi:hypothetical protein